MPISCLRKVSEEEYLRLDDINPYRSEFIDGFMFPMHDHGHTEPFTHLTSKHGLVCSNLCALLHSPARAAGLRLYPGNMRVKVQPIRALNGKWQSHTEKPDLVATAETVKPTATRLYTRNGNDWNEQYAEEKGELRFDTPEITLTLDDIYDGVTF